MSSLPYRRLHAAAEVDATALQVLNLAEVTGERRRTVLRRLSVTFRQVWQHCTDDFRSSAGAARQLRQRLHSPDEACFVALAADGALAGTASVGSDDFYAGFACSNGVVPGPVGRDLWISEAWRGVVVDGLKLWEHLLRARLQWLDQRGGASLTVFTEPGPLDLAALYQRLGASVVRRGLHHRQLGRNCITMLAYPVAATLQRLDALQQQRRALADAPRPPPQRVVAEQLVV